MASTEIEPTKPRHPKVRIAVLLLLAIVALLVYRWRTACVLLPPSGTVRHISSQDWARIELPAIGCSLVNNVWNKAAAGSGFEQQIFSEDLDGAAFGWRWHAPWHLIPRVVSQPQLVCGDKPWDEPLNRNSQFPFRAGSKELTANFNARLDASGTYNMTFSLWAVSSLPASRSVITHEIMIWNANSGQSPGGTKRDVLTVDGIGYDVYVEENQADNSGQNANHWMYVAFVPTTPLLNGRLEISSFIDYLLQKHMITREHYLASLEFGNEVTDGIGIVEIRDFSLVFRE
jgi:Glycosyl hydrolase family 12